MIIAGLISYFYLPMSKTIMILAAFFIILILNYYLIFNKNEYLLVVVFGYLSWIGSIYLYTHSYYYDKIIHLAFAFFIYSVIFNIVQIKEYRIIFCFLATLGILGLWEIYEYFITNYFKLQMTGVFDDSGNCLLEEYKDSIFDMIYGSIGTMVAGAYKSLRIENESYT